MNKLFNPLLNQAAALPPGELRERELQLRELRELSDPSNAERSLSEANRRLLKVRQAAEISQAMRTAKIRGKMRASGLGLQTRI